jgi:cobalamin biosynthesis protein CobD/CbiB
LFWAPGIAVAGHPHHQGRQLEQGQEERARTVLQQWRHLDASELPRTELLRHVIEHALLAAHRHVFGVFFFLSKNGF